MKIAVKVKANAKEDKIVPVDEKNFSVWVKEPPQENRANEAVRKIVSEYFDVAPSQVSIVKGALSPHKLLEIS